MNPKATSHSATPSIFVTGTQRSGTTLLHQILSSSSMVWSQNEMFPIHNLIFGNDGKRSATELKGVLQDFLGEDQDLDEFDTSVYSKITAFDLKMQARARDASKSTWCLKDPRVTYYLEQYAEAFPNARFIILTRDPRAVCRSYLDPRGFTVGRPTNWIVAAERWQHETTRQLEFADTHPNSTLQVKYENLVTNLEEELPRICEFLSIPFETKMLRYYEFDGAVKVHDGNANVLRPPDPTKVDTWRTTLSTQQIETIEHIARDRMTQLGYTSVGHHINIPQHTKIIARVKHSLIAEYRWQRYKLKGKNS